jgi:hypothetical protein
MIFRSPSLSALVTAFVAACVLLVACSDQGEGERCDLANGNNDCQAGLVCKPPTEVHVNGDYDVCCPLDPNKATPGSVCATGSSSLGDSSAPEPDSGDESSDAGTDTTTEAGADGETDASNDSPVDAPDGD